MTIQERHEAIQNLLPDTITMGKSAAHLFTFYERYVFPHVAHPEDPLSIEIVAAGIIGAVEAIVLKEFFPQAVIHVSEPDPIQDPSDPASFLFPMVSKIIPDIQTAVSFSRDKIEDRTAKGFTADIVVFRTPGGAMNVSSGGATYTTTLVNEATKLVKSNALFVSSSYDNSEGDIRKALQTNPDVNLITDMEVKPQLPLISPIRRAFVARKK